MVGDLGGISGGGREAGRAIVLIVYHPTLRSRVCALWREWKDGILVGWIFFRWGQGNGGI